jgi:DNA-binding NarL/FixJ family response regulator
LTEQIKMTVERVKPKVHQTGVRSFPQHRFHAARILVVDDNVFIRRSLRTVLEAHDDWKVCDEACDGREAVRKFDQEKFDVIVLDFQMPGMNGLDAAKEITQRSPKTPILMVTLHDSPQLVEEARKAGIRGVCPKTNIECLVEGVTTILDNKPYFKN